MKRAVLVGLLILSCLAALTVPSRADITIVNGVHIRSGEDVSQFISAVHGASHITFPGTRRWELAEPGGDYQAMPAETVAQAVAAVDYPIDDLGIEILILPLPRRLVPESSAEGRVVFLSPGRTAYPQQHIHYIVAHEIGHVVQHLLMPESRRDLWNRYEILRNLAYPSDQSPIVHAWRPAEVFAEDFRVLFGGTLARCGGNVENHDIVPPEEVAGLREFMLSLRGEWQHLARISVSPNPFEGDVVLEAFSLGSEDRRMEVSIFDIQGRKVTDLRPPAGGRPLLTWNGRDQNGKEAAPGVYFAYVHYGQAIAIHKLIKRR